MAWRDEGERIVSRPTPRIWRAVVAAVSVALLVSGCAGARPGVAVQAGAEHITLKAVDQATRDLCQVFLPQITQQNQSFPLRVIRNLAVEAMTTRLIAETIADEQGLKPTEDYFDQYAVQTQTAQSLDEEVRTTYVELSTASTYSDSIKRQWGLVSLRADGQSAPSGDDQLARGNQLFAEWIDSHDVSFDPRFGMALVDGKAVAADTGVSSPVSAAAVAGLAEQMAAADVAKLPETQRCG